MAGEVITVIGKFVKELSIFDAEFRGGGNVYHVTFAVPCPDVMGDKTRTIKLRKRKDGKWAFVGFHKYGNKVAKMWNTKRARAETELARLEQQQDVALTASKFSKRIRVKKDNKRR